MKRASSGRVAVTPASFTRSLNLEYILHVSAAVVTILTILCASAQAETSCNKADLLVTTTPAIFQNPPAVQIFLNIVEKIDGRVDVVIAGDSIAQRWPGNLLSQIFPGKTIMNIGVGGARTQTALWELETGSFAALQPTEVVLILGTNNLSGPEQPCAIVAGTSLVVAQMRKMWPKAHIDLFDIMPRGADLRFKNDDRIAINEGYRRLAADASRITYIDPDAAISCNGSEDCPNYIRDRLHPSLPGYQALGEVLSHSQAH